MLNWSKTRQEHSYTHQISLCKSIEPLLCPVGAYDYLVSLIPGGQDDPVYAISVNRILVAVSKLVLNSHFKETLVLVDLDPALYMHSFHSIWYGGATLAAKAVTPEIFFEILRGLAF